MKTLGTVVSVVLLAGSLTGCGGYTAGSLHPADVRTVAVDIFESQEFRRGLEQEMTRELVNMILLRTPYRIADKATADTILKGKIIDLAETVLTEGEFDEVTEMQVTLYVEFEWKDTRTGKVRRPGKPHYAWHYAPAEDLTLRSAQTTAIRKLAEAIVEDMEAGW